MLSTPGIRKCQELEKKVAWKLRLEVLNKFGLGQKYLKKFETKQKILTAFEGKLGESLKSWPQSWKKLKTSRRVLNESRRVV